MLATILTMKNLFLFSILYCQFVFGQNIITYKKSGVIFTESYDLMELKDFRRFTPTLLEITELENRIKKYDEIKYVERLSKYYRQYIGYYNSANERVIWVNFLWKKDSNDYDIEGNEIQTWKKMWMQVHDGGNQYWNIKFNPDSKEFYRMVINGEA